MSKENKPDVLSIFSNTDNWDKLSIDTYKEIYSEAKVRYEDILSQSESISNKSQILIMVSGGIAAWTSSFIFDHNISLWVILVLGIIFLFNVGVLTYLFIPRKLPLKGSSPKVIMELESDLVGTGENYTEEQKNKMFYYHQLNRYQDNYQKSRSVMNSRAPKYKLALLLTYILFLSVVAVRFYYPPLVSKSSSSEVVPFGPCKK